MSKDLILAHTGELSEAGSVIGNKVTHVNSLTSTVQSATNLASGSFSGISTLASAGTELEQLQKGITTIMGCLSDSLLLLGNGLQNASREFATTDSNLANMFNSLDQSLQPYIGYEQPPQAPPKPPAPKKSSGGQPWWDKALDITKGIGLSLAAGTTIIAGGGPEDPVGDAGAGFIEGDAIAEFEAAFH